MALSDLGDMPPTPPARSGATALGTELDDLLGDLPPDSPSDEKPKPPGTYIFNAISTQLMITSIPARVLISTVVLFLASIAESYRAKAYFRCVVVL